jgi:predicted MFS family arabinose efflux permease
VGAVLASVFMALSGFFVAAAPLLLQRLLAGVASAFVFIAGGLLAARLGTRQPGQAGLLLGLYYGGVGWGIALAALGVPLLLDAARRVPHGWAWAWWGMALACLAATAVLRWPAKILQKQELIAHVPSGPEADWAAKPRWRPMGWALAGYTLFGVGYIGYMTFVIALLREQGASAGAVTLFYTLLGLAVVASARIWARLLDRARGGGALALLNALLGVATVAPALTGAGRWCWPRACCLARCSCRWWRPPPPSCATTWPAGSGPRASAPSPSCLPSARSSGLPWWAGLLTAPAG